MLKSKDIIVNEFESLTNSKIDKTTQFLKKQIKEGVIYLKVFDNNKVYIGQTSEFEKRMINHRCNARKDTTLVVYKAMRKYKHDTYIIWQGNKDQLNEMEIYFIKLYNSFGDNGYNLSHGGEGFRRGSEHPFSKEKEHFEKKSIHPFGFKKICGRQGWVFREFKPVLCENRNKQGRYEYYWYYIGKQNKDYFVFNNEVEYVAKNKMVRNNFKNWAKNKELDFLDFNEIDSGELSSSGHRLCFYVFVGNKEGKMLKDKVKIPTKEIREDIRYYENKDTLRSSFISWCKTHDYNINDFIEVVKKTEHRRDTLYNYIYVGNDNGDILEKWKNRQFMPEKHLRESKGYYSERGTTKGNFKAWLNTKLWTIGDFIEIFSGMRCGTQKLYFYIPK